MLFKMDFMLRVLNDWFAADSDFQKSSPNRLVYSMVTSTRFQQTSTREMRRDYTVAGEQPSARLM